MSDTLRPRLKDVVFAALAEFGADSSRITEKATLEDLDIDSLDVVELCQVVDDEFEVKIPPDRLVGITTVGQALDGLAGIIEEQQANK